MSEWAGGYACKLCKGLLHGAAAFLRQWHPEGDIDAPDDQRGSIHESQTLYPMNNTDSQQNKTLEEETFMFP